eukprot:4924530-Prymnesium_polylepis.2
MSDALGSASVGAGVSQLSRWCMVLFFHALTHSYKPQSAKRAHTDTHYENSTRRRHSTNPPRERMRGCGRLSHKAYIGISPHT